MALRAVFEWTGQEHLYEEKSADWYWALGIVATAAIIVSILFSNILLALVIAAGSVALGLAAAKRPQIHHFSINEDGVAIDNNMYLFSSMRSFSVLEYADEKIPPSLSMKTNHLLAPHVIIPIMNHDPVQIFEFVSQHVEEGRHDRPTALEHLVSLFRL